ncbi:MAG TPA: uracil-xanthine permease [Candidatus Scatomorpha stercorigallinarum]|nr:uracil-xanthine permease [Candidatus Scatomorpha stercorigallinarum]
MNKKTIGSEPIYDARSLGAPRMFVLGVQHMFAMFGATVLVPTLTGLSVSVTLLFAGLGTLLFHLLAKGKVPAFLGSSFAFIGGYAAIAPMLPDAAGNLTVPNTEMLPYACFGVVCAGLVYLVLAALFRAFGVKKVMRFFPPIVTGPIIISIGLSLSSSAVNNCQASWPVALVAILVVIVCNIWGRGMVKIIPILLGVIASYAVGAAAGQVDFSAVREAPWIGLPVVWEETVFSIFDGGVDTALLLTAAITIVPISLATVVEHIGDMCAISSTCERNYIEDPGLHRTLLGDGLATSLAALFGAPANTTYGENTGVLALSRVYDPRVIRIAAVLAIAVSFCPKFAEVVHAMPTATIGGVSLVLYGMISAVGVRNVVENRVDFTKSRNVIIAALILVLAIGITYSEAGSVHIAGDVSFSGLATAAIVGIVLNAVLPGKDYEFGADLQGDTSVNFKV